MAGTKCQDAQPFFSPLSVHQAPDQVPAGLSIARGQMAAAPSRSCKSLTFVSHVNKRPPKFEAAEHCLS